MRFRTTTPTGLPVSNGVGRLIALMAGIPLLLGATVIDAGSMRAASADSMAGEPQVGPVDTSWRTLLGLDYRTGEITAELEDRRGQVVRIPGFMVPFEDGLDGVTEFLLVPYFGACIHTPPPPPNQMVYVQMDRGRTVDVNIWDAIWIEGTFEIEDIDSAYGEVGFKVIGDRIRPYGDED